MKGFIVGLCFAVALFATQDAVYAGRYYTPEIARWATPDPALRDKLPNELVEIHNGMLLSTSPYAYTYNNPLKYTDPDGKIPTIAIGALSGAALDLGLQVATNYVQGRSLTDISWKQVAISAGLGAAGAGLASKAGQLFRLASKADDVVNLADDATRGVTKLADEVGGLADDAGKAVRWGFWDDLPKVTRDGREYAQIGDRLYTQHAIERMTPSGFGTAARTGGVSGRGVPTMVVEHVLAKGTITGQRTVQGVTRISRTLGKVEVVTENDIVITVITR